MRQVKHCFKCSGRGHEEGNPFGRCGECHGTGIREQRCNQCWRWKPILAFFGKLKEGRLTIKANCHQCTEKYRGFSGMTRAERDAIAGDSRKGLDTEGPMRVFLSLKSGNRKTGPIPVSMTAASSCPPSCSYFGAGCYAERHIIGMHWRRLSRGEGRTWEAFCEAVRKLPSGQLWRHNEAGDLPGKGEELSESQIVELAGAARHTKGFTYTHKLGSGLEGDEKELHFAKLRYLNESGVTVNLSVDRFEELDDFARWGLPMVTVLPEDAPRVSHTKGGRKVIVCPAQVNEGTQCATCGICQANRADRAIVGFLAHGNASAAITERLRPKRQLPLFQDVEAYEVHRVRVGAWYLQETEALKGRGGKGRRMTKAKILCKQCKLNRRYTVAVEGSDKCQGCIDAGKTGSGFAEAKR